MCRISMAYSRSYILGKPPYAKTPVIPLKRLSCHALCGAQMPPEAEDRTSVENGHHT